MSRRTRLTSDLDQAPQDPIAACCERHDVTLLALATGQDQVPVSVSAPPRLRPTALANRLKGFRSRYRRERFAHLQGGCGKEQRWRQRYTVGTAGAVSAETIRRSLREC